MSPAEMLQKIRSVSVRDQALKALMDSEQKIIELQRAQIFAGRRSDDTSIVPPYSPIYAKKKGKKTPDLYDTGAFQNAIFADIREDFVAIGSADSKTQKLIEKYSEKIFGLDSRSRIQLNQYINNVFLKRMHGLLNL